MFAVFTHVATRYKKTFVPNCKRNCPEGGRGGARLPSGRDTHDVAAGLFLVFQCAQALRLSRAPARVEPEESSFAITHYGPGSIRKRLHLVVITLGMFYLGPSRVRVVDHRRQRDKVLGLGIAENRRRTCCHKSEFGRTATGMRFNSWHQWNGPGHPTRVDPGQ